MKYRITSIGHPNPWYRVRSDDKHNTEQGCGNSVDDAITDAMTERDAKIRKLQKRLREMKKYTGHLNDGKIFYEKVKARTK